MYGALLEICKAWKWTTLVLSLSPLVLLTGRECLDMRMVVIRPATSQGCATGYKLNSQFNPPFAECTIIYLSCKLPIISFQYDWTIGLACYGLLFWFGGGFCQGYSVQGIVYSKKFRIYAPLVVWLTLLEGRQSHCYRTRKQGN